MKLKHVSGNALPAVDNRLIPVAFTAGQHRNEAHFIHASITPRITIKRVPRWHRASIYN